MKIFLVAQGIYPQRGGVELHVYRIAQGLRARRHDVVAIVSSGNYSDRQKDGFRVVQGATLGTVEHLLVTEMPDALHGHGARSIFVARCLRAAHRLGVRTVFTPHCFYPAQDFPGKLKRLLFDKTLGRAALNACDSIVALTENDFRDAVALGAAGERINIVPNSVVLSTRLPTDQVLSWRARYGLERFLLSVGRLDRIKRGDFLVRALLSLPRDLAMVFIGPDAGCRTEWEALSVELGVERAVHFLGEVSDDDLRAAYQSCAALVLASRYEGLPTVILEAMASGSPVVAAATGGTSCVIKHGENGLLFSYDDTSEFVAAVQRALAPGALAIAEQARRIVAAEYSWDVNIPKICNLYAFNPEMGEEGACALAQ